MQARLMSASVAAVAATALLFGAQRAQAGSVTMLLDHTTGQTANATFNGSPSSASPGPYYWKNPTTALNANTAAFCVQLDQFVTLGNTYTYQTTSLANLPTIGSEAKANYITELFGRYFDPTWLNPSFTGSTASLAFQLALWELVYDGPTNLNVNDTTKTLGTFSDTSSGDAAAASLAQKFLKGGSGGYVALSGDTSVFASRLPGYTLTGLTDQPVGGANSAVAGGVQDQIVITPPGGQVPAPAGVWLAGAGLVALFGRGRLRKKSTETAA